MALATMASPGRSPQLEAIARRYREQTGGRVLIVGPKGRRVYDSGPGLGGTSFASRPEIARALDGQVATGTRFSRSLGHDLIYVAVPVAAEGRVRGAVRITYPTSTVDARVHRYWLILVAIAALVLSAALAIGLLFARSIARPLEALRGAAVRAGGGDLSTRAPVGLGPPEVRAVAVAFNDTVAKLDALVHAQDEFVADASHQLRSPLAALRLRLENLERDVPDSGRAGLAGAASEVERLSRVVDGLLALARADRAPSTADPIDLAPLVLRAAGGVDGLRRRARCRAPRAARAGRGGRNTWSSGAGARQPPRQCPRRGSRRDDDHGVALAGCRGCRAARDRRRALVSRWPSECVHSIASGAPALIAGRASGCRSCGA